jgi:predicted amidophosphoribosyltransferase
VIASRRGWPKWYSESPQAWRADLVVPVPLHADRLRERGSNQAELIARPLAKHLNLEFGAYLLARTKPRPSRLVLSRTERWTSVRGAYATRNGAAVDNVRILLVDDVLTTGATWDACFTALKKAGAVGPLALAVARVVASQSVRNSGKSGSRNRIGFKGISLIVVWVG